MAAIFLSYKRADTGGDAGRLFGRLQYWFDADALFNDPDAIDSGGTFPQPIEASIRDAKVLLVIIYPDRPASLNGRVGQPGIDRQCHRERKQETGG